MLLQMPEAQQKRAHCTFPLGFRHLHGLGIGRNADDWAVVLVSALHGVSVAAYAGKTRLRM